MILSNDSVTIVNAPLLLSQLQNDSALLRREILLSQAEESNLVALHIDKIDNDYSQIGIWGGILSIIFLIFGFFAIFKIEETKADAKNTLDKVTTQGQKATNEIKELQEQAGQLNGLFNSNNQKARELDHVKDATGHIKNFCNLRVSMNPDKFKIELSKFITPDMKVYTELEDCIFHRK